MKNKKDNLSNLLEIKNQTETTVDLYFYGDIVSSYYGAWDDTDQYPESVKNFLDEVKGKDLNIYINSGGGSVFAGMAIYNMLKRHTGFKTVYVDGIAASIASVITLAGDKIIMPENTLFMVHKPWCGTSGNAKDLREQADILDKIEEGILNVYSENLKEGIDIETIKEMVDKETWLTGLEASNYFNIEVSDAIDAVACVSEFYDGYNKVPNDISNTFRDDLNRSGKLENEKEELLMELDLM